MRVRRALLYIPGDSQRKIHKATTLGADSICLDMDDGVAVNQKQAARATIAWALENLRFGRSERLVRLNPLGSGFEAEDFAQTVNARPDGVVLPKVESAEAIGWLDVQLTQAEQSHGWPPGGIRMIAIIETARGIVNLEEIAAASQRLDALAFGAEDLAGDIGAVRTAQGSELCYARSAVVIHAAAFRLQAIDMVYVRYKDTTGLVREAQEAAGLGFAGKQAIHPDQIPAIHAAFTPSEDAIAYAQRVVEANRAYQSAGIGAFELDGKMVDLPVVKAAEQVLAKARAAGRL